MQAQPQVLPCVTSQEMDAGQDFRCIVCGSTDWCGCQDRIYCKRCCRTIRESCEAEE
ncbi:MAG: hypothetical protein KGI33_04830 [Thaumarchaeota archaeon]|nr:hypothetical protein [Nitrososphaerota archaeon]